MDDFEIQSALRDIRVSHNFRSTREQFQDAQGKLCSSPVICMLRFDPPAEGFRRSVVLTPKLCEVIREMRKIEDYLPCWEEILRKMHKVDLKDSTVEWGCFGGGTDK